MIWQTNITANPHYRQHGYMYPVPYDAGFDQLEPWHWIGFTAENLFRFGFVVGPPKATEYYSAEQLTEASARGIWLFAGALVGLYELEPGDIVNAMVLASPQPIAISKRETWCCWCGDPACTGLGPGETEGATIEC